MAGIDRNDPERLLIHKQELAARPKLARPDQRWPANGEFVPPPRSGPRPSTRFLDLTREALPEAPLRFVSSRAAEATRTVASGVSWPSATLRTPPKPQEPSSTTQRGGKGHANVLTGKALKVVVVLNAAEVAALVVKNGEPRVVLTIRLPDRTVTADISAKSARRAIAAIGEHGVDGVACVLQGRLMENRIEDAGLAVQPKAKPSGEAVA